jgi:hypothetical protein
MVDAQPKPKGRGRKKAVLVPFYDVLFVKLTLPTLVTPVLDTESQRRKKTKNC